VALVDEGIAPRSTPETDCDSTEVCEELTGDKDLDRDADATPDLELCALDKVDREDVIFREVELALCDREEKVDIDERVLSKISSTLDLEYQRNSPWGGRGGRRRRRGAAGWRRSVTTVWEYRTPRDRRTSGGGALRCG
jgi:hypothetical protein